MISLSYGSKLQVELEMDYLFGLTLESLQACHRIYNTSDVFLDWKMKSLCLPCI